MGRVEGRQRESCSLHLSFQELEDLLLLVMKHRKRLQKGTLMKYLVALFSFKKILLASLILYLIEL